MGRLLHFDFNIRNDKITTHNEFKKLKKDPE